MSKNLESEQIDLGTAAKAAAVAGALNLGAAVTLPKNCVFEITEIKVTSHDATPAVADVVINVGGAAVHREHITTRGSHLFQRGFGNPGLGLKIGKDTADRLAQLAIEDSTPATAIFSGTAKLEQMYDDPSSVPTTVVPAT